MFKKTLAVSAVCIGLIGFFVTGCSEKTDLSLKLTPQSVQAYKYSQETVKQVKFDRPSEKETSDKITKNAFDMTFDQKVLDVEKDGSVIAEITVKSFAYTLESPKGAEGTSEEAKTQSVDALAGKSYKIKLSPAGKAELVDASAVLAAVTSGRDARIVQSFFGADEVAKRHSIAALSNAKNLSSIKSGEQWTVTEESPKGMMQSKNYEKIYTFKEAKKNDAGNKIAVIEMATIPAEGPVSAGMFAMFGDKIESDFKDSYAGVFEYNVSTGTILKYNEALSADWVAVDKSKQKNDELPDTLTISFKNNFSLESVN